MLKETTRVRIHECPLHSYPPTQQIKMDGGWWEEKNVHGDATKAGKLGEREKHMEKLRGGKKGFPRGKGSRVNPIKTKGGGAKKKGKFKKEGWLTGSPFETGPELRIKLTWGRREKESGRTKSHRIRGAHTILKCTRKRAENPVGRQENKKEAKLLLVENGLTISG